MNPVGQAPSSDVPGGTHAAIPQVHLLSNGTYHVMLTTTAGGGYSCSRNLAVTRWREDPTCDGWGSDVEPGRSNAALLHVAADLADRFHAGVIGIASSQPVQVVYSDGYVPDDLIERDRVEIEPEMNEAEAELRHFLQSRVAHLDWGSTMAFAPLSDHLSREARCADLFITGVAAGGFSTVPDREIQVISSCRSGDRC